MISDSKQDTRRSHKRDKCQCFSFYNFQMSVKGGGVKVMKEIMSLTDTLLSEQAMNKKETFEQSGDFRYYSARPELLWSQFCNFTNPHPYHLLCSQEIS